jgi:hypothetical protein
VTKMLLAWDSGDEIHFHELTRGSRQADWAIQSSGLYINPDKLRDTHPIFKLNDWLATTEGKASRIEGTSATGPYDCVVVCGFAL